MKFICVLCFFAILSCQTTKKNDIPNYVTNGPLCYLSLENQLKHLTTSYFGEPVDKFRVYVELNDGTKTPYSVAFEKDENSNNLVDKNDVLKIFPNADTVDNLKYLDKKIIFEFSYLNDKDVHVTLYSGKCGVNEKIVVTTE